MLADGSSFICFSCLYIPNQSFDYYVNYALCFRMKLWRSLLIEKTKFINGCNSVQRQSICSHEYHMLLNFSLACKVIIATLNSCIRIIRVTKIIKEIISGLDNNMLLFTICQYHTKQVILLLSVNEVWLINCLLEANTCFSNSFLIL